MILDSLGSFLSLIIHIADFGFDIFSSPARTVQRRWQAITCKTVCVVSLIMQSKTLLVLLNKYLPNPLPTSSPVQWQNGVVAVRSPLLIHAALANKRTSSSDVTTSEAKVVPLNDDLRSIFFIILMVGVQRTMLESRCGIPRKQAE